MAADVTTKSVDYIAHQWIWQRIRDFVEGEDAVKKRAAAYHPPATLYMEPIPYLPKPAGQDEQDYAQYLAEAEVYGATGRTVEGLVGAVFRIDPEIELTGSLTVLEENADNKQTPLQLFAKQTLREVIILGRYGVLVDLPTAERAGAVPYLCGYAAETIINWRVELIEEAPRLTRVVLEECFTEPDPLNEFADMERKRYRVHELVDGRYQVRTFRYLTGADGKELTGQFVQETEQPIVPIRRGAALDYIPFVLIGPLSLDPMVQKSPVLDLVNVNLHHFRLSAKLDHALFIVSVPQPVVIGDTNQTPGQPLPYRIGGSVAWLLPTGAQAMYLEHAGTGISSIESNLARDESRMVLLGARLLEPQKREAETAEALRLRQAGESATLATITDTVTWGLSMALGWAADWAGENPEKNYLTLNQDFADMSMTEDDANKLIARWQQGGATQDDVFFLLQRGNRIEPEITAEQWKAKLQDQAPLPPPLPEAAPAEPMPAEPPAKAA